MNRIDLEAEPRAPRGSRAARRHRRKGFVPSVLYGHGEPLSLLVERHPFETAIRKSAGANIIWNLKVKGAAEQSAIIRTVQRHPVARTIDHVDFLRVVLTEKIVAKVHIELAGVSPAVKSGAILMQMIREVEVRSLPLEIPEKVIIDLSKLENIGDTVHVSAIVLPEGVEMVTEGDQTIISVQPPAAEEAAPTPAAAPAEGAAAPAAGAAPDVIEKGKEKKAEGEEAKDAKDSKKK